MYQSTGNSDDAVHTDTMYIVERKCSSAHEQMYTPMPRR